MPSWTPQQVLALAPDASASKAGQGLASPRSWSGWGRTSGRFGVCVRGVGRSRIRRRSICRSRRSSAVVRRASSRVSMLLGSCCCGRRPVRCRSRRGRSGSRSGWPLASSVLSGRRCGLTAARMVDAQASGLATRVRRIGNAPYSAGDAWAERMLEEVSLLQLLGEAYERRELLSEPTQADVRQLVGWSVPTEEVLAGERVRDTWAVVGQVVTEDERLRSQRTWLRGETTRRDALIFLCSGGAGARSGCRLRHRCRCGAGLLSRRCSFARSCR